VIRDVEALNRRIKAELDGRGLGGGFDVKTGHGGIREIEFFVQALQLVHAGKNPSLRERSTRRALDRLLFAGLIAERERRALADAYAFLRQVEHRLQLVAGRQTHRLPDDVHALSTLGLRLGFGGVGELATTLEHRTRAVSEIFATLGSEPPLRPEVAVVLDATRGGPELEAALEALGFADPATAAFHLDLLRRKPASPFGPAATGAAARVAPTLIEELAASPDPDQALAHAVDFVGRFALWEGMWALLAENRPLVRVLASLFGTSAYLTKQFLAHPELIDLWATGNLGRARPRLALDDPEQAGNALRRLKNEEILRIGLADIAGELDLEEVFERLSDLADTCVASTYDIVRAVLERRHGRLAPMAVLGLGKLGGREMGYASDLDLVFLYDGDLDDHERMTKLAQRLVSALATYTEDGRLYEVDTRLRPSGQKGTLVSSLAGWREYHATQARMWERQALIKCRTIAGDAALGETVTAEAARFVYGKTTPASVIADELRTMRARIETELAREQGGRYDLKTGRGGLMDVEFAAQYLQLVHGPAHPELRVRATLPALAAAARLGVLGDADRAVLVGGYRFLRLIENRLRIVHDRPIHELRAEGGELDPLARRCGFASGGALERAYLSWTRDVRAVYQRLLHAGSP
jgi:glutamate-ammonia-ligase adenylyltransferase